MNHWQKMSKEIPSHYQVGRYGRLIYPWPWQHLPVKSPQTFDAATQTNRAKSLPESHFSSNASFFAFVTITACISSAHMLLFIMLFAHALQLRHATCSHWLVSFICSTYYGYGHFMGRKRSAARLSEVTTVKLSSGRQTKICRIPGPALSSASLCLYVQLLGWHPATQHQGTAYSIKTL